MTPRLINTLSAVVLGISGAVLLFAADQILPALLPVPASAAWFGQLLGAAWLGVAALDWFARGLTIGGIYGRPVVMANLLLYFASATSLLKVSVRPLEDVVGAAGVVAAVMAGLYGWLLYRPPSGERQA